jgi:predicted component of type VI protein secretion system
MPAAADAHNNPTWSPPAAADVQAFQRGAGLAAGDLSAADAQRLMALAGLLLREMTTGLVAQARLRSQRDDQTDGRTGRFDLRRDPIEHAGSVDEALCLLLDEKQKRLVPPVDAVRAAFNRLETQQRNAVHAARQTLQDVLNRLSPSEIEQRFGPAQNDASAAHCWRQLCALHERLVGEDGLPRSWNSDYAAALRMLGESED